MARIKVLVVDDDESIIRLVQEILGTAGIDSDAASSAADALAMMDKNPYSVVVSDIHMPGMSGVELISALKKVSPTVQVIMLTSDSSFKRVVECVDRGAVDFFSKETKQLPLMVESVGAALGRLARWGNWLGRHSGWELVEVPQVVL